MSFNAHIQERFQDFEGASDFEISLIKYRVKFPDVDRLSEISEGFQIPSLDRSCAQRDVCMGVD